MPAPPVQPIVIWFGRVGDLILLSALLEILHRRFGSPCHVIGAGAWLGEIYAAHADVAWVSCLHRYTAWAFDPIWWRTRRALRASRAGPVYVCETDLRKLARIRRLLRFSGIEAARCVFLAQTDLDTAQPPTSKVAPTHRVDAQTDLDTALPHTSKIAPTHWVDRLVSFGRLTPAAFDAADYPWPAPAPRGAPLLTVSEAARAECAAWLERQGWRDRTLILVQPGNRRTMRGRRLRVSPADDKAWPLERWAALLHRIHARLPQAVMVLFGAHSPQQWLPRSPTGSPVCGVGGPPQCTRLDQISVETVFAAWCALGTAAQAPGAPAPGADGALTTTAARATAP